MCFNVAAIEEPQTRSQMAQGTNVQVSGAHRLTMSRMAGPDLPFLPNPLNQVVMQKRNMHAYLHAQTSWPRSAMRRRGSSRPPSRPSAAALSRCVGCIRNQ